MKSQPLIERKDSPQTRQVRSFALEIRANDDGTIEGYGSVFNVVDNYDDVIAKGAFVKSLADHKAAGTMPAMLWQHDADKPIGIWTEMVEDAKGLRLKGQLALETRLGKEAQSLLKMGALNGLSIGFMSRQWAYDRDTEIRTLTEVDLWEVSLVTFPANTSARVTSVKAADAGQIKTVRQAEKALRDAGFSDDAARAFVAQIKRVVLDERDAHKATAQAVEAANKLLHTIQN
jgi:HK97 family phage prohead protease